MHSEKGGSFTRNVLGSVLSEAAAEWGLFIATAAILFTVNLGWVVVKTSSKDFGTSGRWKQHMMQCA